MPSRLSQAPSHAVRRSADNIETSGDESNTSRRKRESLPQRTFEMKEAWASEELPRFFVTGQTEPVNKPSHFYCQVCCRDVSVDSRFLWNHETLPGNEAFSISTVSTVVFWDSWRRVLGFSEKLHTRKWGGASAQKKSCRFLWWGVIAWIFSVKVWLFILVALWIHGCSF